MVKNELANVDDNIGKALKDARLRKNLKVEDVAKTLKIRATYIVAIEDGDFSRLPSEVYLIGYIRTYSAFLGCSNNWLIKNVEVKKMHKEDFKKQTQAGNDNLAEEYEALLNEKPPWLLMISIMMAGVLVSTWLYFR